MHYKEGGEPAASLALRIVLARRRGLRHDDAHAPIIALGRDAHASAPARDRLRLAGRVGGLRQGSLLDRRQGRLRREGRQGGAEATGRA